MYRSLLVACALAAAPVALAQTAAPVVTGLAVAPAASPLVGSWRYAIGTPEGTLRGRLVVETSGGAWTGRLSRDDLGDALAPLQDVRTGADGTLHGWVTTERGRADLALSALGDALSGVVDVGGVTLTLSGEREAVAPATDVAGAWTYALETPNGASSGRIELARGADGTLSGRIVRSTGEVSELTRATLDGDVLTLVYPSGRYGALTMRLTREGDALVGALLVGQSEMSVRATRATN